MASPSDLRPHLVEALTSDLVGPYAEGEVLRLPPSRWYLTGFLVPRDVRESEEDSDPTADEELPAGNDETEEETAGAEPEPKQKNRLPASMGLSVLLPGGDGSDVVTATLSFGEYVPEERETDGHKRKQRVWRRFGRGPVSVDVPLDPKKVAAGVRVKEFPGSSSRASWRRQKPRACRREHGPCPCSW